MKERCEERSRLIVKTGLLPVKGKAASMPWLWIGTWSMGGEGFGPHDLSLSIKTLEKAYELGLRHFDTAGFYAQGRSEELIRKVFSRVRKRIFISTKGGLWRKGRRVWHDARPEALRLALIESLERLGTDYIDLFQLHWPDPDVPLNESIDALRQLKEEGLTRYWGVGNLSVEQVKYHLPSGGLIPHQVHFNPVHKEGIKVLKAGKVERRCLNCVISPFEQGLLVSPTLFKKGLGKKDVRNRNPYFKDEKIKKRLSRFFDACEEQGIYPASAVLAWILGHREVDIVIPGPKRPEHIGEICGIFGMVNGHESSLIDKILCDLKK